MSKVLTHIHVVTRCNCRRISFLAQLCLWTNTLEHFVDQHHCFRCFPAPEMGFPNNKYMYGPPTAPDKVNYVAFQATRIFWPNKEMPTPCQYIIIQWMEQGATAEESQSSSNIWAWCFRKSFAWPWRANNCQFRERTQFCTCCCNTSTRKQLKSHILLRCRTNWTCEAHVVTNVQQKMPKICRAAATCEQANLIYACPNISIGYPTSWVIPRFCMSLFVALHLTSIRVYVAFVYLFRTSHYCDGEKRVETCKPQTKKSIIFRHVKAYSRCWPLHSLHLLSDLLRTLLEL